MSSGASLRSQRRGNPRSYSSPEARRLALEKLNDEYGEINRKREETERKAAALAKLNDEYEKINRKREETERKAAALAKLNRPYGKLNRRLRRKNQQDERSNAKLSRTIETSLELLSESMGRPAFQAAKVDDFLGREVQSVVTGASRLKTDLLAASARPGLVERHAPNFRRRFNTIRGTDNAVQKVTQRAIADLASERKELRKITTGLRKAIGLIERDAPRATDRRLKKEAKNDVRKKLLDEWGAKGSDLESLRSAKDSFDAVERFRFEKVRPNYTWVQKRLEALGAQGEEKKKGRGGLQGSEELRRGAFDGGSRVRVFEHLPWFGSKVASAAELKERWPALQWPADTRAPEKTPCQSTTPLGLNRAQKIAMHYLSPFNSAGGGVLVHSAGSGKSATAALIASNLVRDDPERVIWWVTKPGQNHLGRQGISAATDFNLQQWLNGEPLLEKVLASIPQMKSDRLKRVFLARLSREMTRLSLGKDRLDETFTTAQLDELRRNVEEGGGEGKNEPTTSREVEDGAMFWAEIRIIRGVFGARWVSCSYEEFAYACGAHLKKTDFPTKPETINGGKLGALNAARRKRLEAMGIWGEAKDPLRKACVFIDEAHTVVSDAYEANGEPGRVFRLLERMVRACWRSRAMSGASEGAQFYLLTATPVVDHPIDVINLGLLVAPKPQGSAAYLGSFMDVNINTTKDRLSAKQSTMHRFNVAHTDGRGRIKPGAVADIQNLIRGRFLVFNYVGDTSHFASPRVEWVDVDLSLAQIGSLLEDHAYPTTGYVRIPEREGAPIADTSRGIGSDRSVKGKLVYRDGKLCRVTRLATKGSKGRPGRPAQDTCDAESLQFHEAAQKEFGSTAKAASKLQDAIDQLGRSDALALAQGDVPPTASQVRLVRKKYPGAKLPLPGSTEEKKWARRHAVWPKASTLRERKGIETRVLRALEKAGVTKPTLSDVRAKSFNPPSGYSEFVARDKLLHVISPVMASLLDGIHAAREMDGRRLDDYYRFRSGGAEAGTQQRLRYLKQFVHVDTSEKYGSNIVESVLQAAGYQILDFPVDDSLPVVVRNAKAGEERAFEDYRGVAVLTPTNKSRVLKFFNHPDNRDGKKCLILVGYERYREGIDALQIGTAHIVGYFSSDADMIQATFRSLRNCSRNLTPYTPGEGWPLRVRIYNPVFPGTSTSAMDLLKLFDKNLKKTEALRAHITDVYEGAAVDRLLLEPINRTSSEVIEKLTADRPDRRMDWTNHANGGEMDTEEEEEEEE
jgi:hypothetical protein